MPPDVYDPEAMYGQQRQDINAQSEADLAALREALNPMIEREAALKEEAYRNPHRTLAQAITQAFSGAIPGLVGAAVGGQRGAGYGFQSGGKAAEDLGLHYGEQDKENKLTSKAEYANAIRERQQQEEDIEGAGKEKRSALRELGYKEIEGAQKERQFGIEEKRYAAAEADRQEKEDRMERNSGAAMRYMGQQAVEGLNSRALVTRNSLFTMPAISKVNEAHAGLQQINDLYDATRDAVNAIGGNNAAYSKFFDPASAMNISSIESGLRAANKATGDSAAVGNPNKSEMQMIMAGLPTPKDILEHPEAAMLKKKEILAQIEVDRQRAENRVKNIFGQFGYDYAPKDLTAGETLQRNQFGYDMIDSRSDRAYRRPGATPAKSATQQPSAPQATTQKPTIQTSTPQAPTTQPPQETEMERYRRLKAKYSQPAQPSS